MVTNLKPIEVGLGAKARQEFRFTRLGGKHGTNGTDRMDGKQEVFDVRRPAGWKSARREAPALRMSGREGDLVRLLRSTSNGAQAFRALFCIVPRLHISIPHGDVIVCGQGFGDAPMALETQRLA
jgi:hypothetical protein